jgi:magnesium-transporting ATPase (P-type)
MTGEKEEGASGALHRMIGKYCPFVPPILSALSGQLKEPLILMLLGSAGISIALDNTADAISIAIALLIVSLVAAVQEYRSEAALEKLANLVPHVSFPSIATRRQCAVVPLHFASLPSKKNAHLLILSII